MRNRFVFIGIAFLALSIIFSFGVPAQAIGNCGVNDLFLKESDDNTHTQVCSPTAPYTNKATWIWGGLSSTSRTCDGSNIVVRLSDDGSAGGAHAARPDLPDPGGYATPVCYGNLRCSNNSAVFGPNCLYSIASDSNAPISACDFPTYMNIYCKDVGGGGPVCGNGICEAGETNVNCPGDCPVGGGACPDPDARITTPPLGVSCNVFGIAGNINFSQQQARNDTCFDYLWNFGDGVTAATWNATHQYASTGQQHITLTVTRKNDGKISVDENSILVVDQSAPQDTSFVCAKISEPQEGDAFNTSEYVLFSGNQSFAVTVYDEGGGNLKLKCAAGPCPECIVNPEGNIPSPCPPGSKIIDPSNDVKANLDNDKGWQAVNFLWDFGDGSRYYNLSINGSLYYKLFASPGVYTNKLTVLYATDPSVNGTDSVTINVERGPGCHDNKRIFVDSLGNEFPTNTETAPGSGVSVFSQCRGLDGNPATPGDNCCAGSEGWRCYGSDPADTDPAKLNHCVKNLPPATCSGVFTCSNYTNSVDCAADVCGVAEPGGVTGIGCIIGSGKCKCAWNATISSCVSRCDVNCSYPKKGNPGPPAECIKTYTQGPCVNQLFLLSWIASLAGVLPPAESAESLGCVPGSKTYSCGRIAKLAFFTLKNVIAVIILLAAFYLIINRKNIHKRFSKTRG